MLKTHRLFLLTITLTILFGLLVYPSLASDPKAPLPPSYAIQSGSNQITFTVVTTLFLPIVLRPIAPPNNLEIIALNYAAQDETITIKNNGPASQSLDGWQIESVVGTQTYIFPNGITLGVGQTVRVHSGPSAFNNPPQDQLWSFQFLWNNEGDKAELRDNQGALRDSFCYLGGCP